MTPQEPMFRLADYMPAGAGISSVAMSEVEGQELTVLSFDVVNGRYGQFALIYCVDENGEDITVRSSSSFIISALMNAKQQGALPAKATFRKVGQAWTVE